MRYFRKYLPVYTNILQIIQYLGLATAAALFLPMPAYAQGCWSDAPSWVSIDREPYAGYEPGYKGSMEPDETWFRAVRPVKQADEKILYRLKLQSAKDKTLYDSIETVSLGGQAIGFAAYQNGCGALLDAHGKKFKLPQFTSIIQDHISEGQDANVVRLKLEGLASSGWRYAIFSNGKLKVLSKNDYLRDCCNSGINERNDLPPGYQSIAVSESDGLGVIRLDTLDEVIAPRWAEVGGVVYEDPKSGKARLVYFITKKRILDDEQTLFLFSSNGNPITMPPFDDIKVVYEWFWFDASSSRMDRTVITTINKFDATCRIYKLNMALIIDEDIQIDKTTRECPRPKETIFSFTNVFGTVQIYEFTLGDKFVKRGEVTDTLVYKFSSGVMVFRKGGSGVMVFQKDAPEGVTFWVADKYGVRLSDTDFTALTPLGCDFVRVKRDGVWVMLLPDGTIDKRMSVPFSC